MKEIKAWREKYFKEIVIIHRFFVNFTSRAVFARAGMLAGRKNWQVKTIVDSEVSRICLFFESQIFLHEPATETVIFLVPCSRKRGLLARYNNLDIKLFDLIR